VKDQSPLEVCSLSADFGFILLSVVLSTPTKELLTADRVQDRISEQPCSLALPSALFRQQA
jgi:hypothetical protein